MSESYGYPRPEDAIRFPFVQHRIEQYELDEQTARGQEFLRLMEQRRSVRTFSGRPVPRHLLELAIRTAATAPSGAHMQPWKFVIVGDPTVKCQIRVAAEEEERINYDGRMNDEWREALAHLGTHWQKGYLETAPWLVVVFEERYGTKDDGSRQHHYYVKESVGLACGLFIAALHNMGLATLPHTPSPMAFLTKLLGRPDNERPFVLFPVGYPTPDAQVPVLARKPLDQVMIDVPDSSGPSKS